MSVGAGCKCSCHEDDVLFRRSCRPCCPPPKTCRQCSECEGFHHWLESVPYVEMGHEDDPESDVIGIESCKHCELRRLDKDSRRPHAGD